MSIRCTITGNMATKFRRCRSSRIADAIAADGMVVESDLFGSDRHASSHSLPGSREPRKLHALYTRTAGSETWAQYWEH